MSPRFILALLLIVSVARAAERPNILFVYTDDQRWDGMGVVQKEGGGHARFPWLQTPNMDRLAAEGVRFRNAFVTNSLCAPSRAVFLTGRYNHLNGIANNHTSFPEGSTTYATLLRANGYTTGFVGKWHMGGQSGQRPGFDFSASFVGQGKYFDCPIEVNGKATPSKGWVDDATTDYAIQFMREKKDQPFMLSVAFKATHGPFQPPPRAAARFKDETMYSVPNLDVPAIYLAAVKGKTSKHVGSSHIDYFQCISGADDNLGRLLAALDELHLREKTVVIFSTDNGYYLGEHGLGDKRTAYDEAMRIPLIISWPKHFPSGETRDQMVLNIDYAPTFLDLAGVTAPPEMQGRSMVPLAKSKSVEGWRTSFFYEYFAENKFSAPTVFAVRTEAAKLIKYPGHEEWTEVFDLKADPYEIKNLVADPARKDLTDSLRAEFDKQVKAVNFAMPAYADKAVVSAEASHETKCVLDLDFSKGQAADASEFKLPLTATGISFVPGQPGKQAAKFGSSSSLEIPKKPVIDPSKKPWTVEATVKAEGLGGAIVARGGASQGYSLYLVDGKPVFTVNVARKTESVTGKTSIVGKWTELKAVINGEHVISLYVDGQLAGTQPLRGFIADDPNDSMSVGADTGSPVTAYKHGRNFQGLIERLKAFSGEDLQVKEEKE